MICHTCGKSLWASSVGEICPNCKVVKYEPGPVKIQGWKDNRIIIDDPLAVSGNAFLDAIKLEHAIESWNSVLEDRIRKYRED